VQLRRRRDDPRRRRHRLLLTDPGEAATVQFNLADLWERVVDEIPDHEALVCGERRLTYHQADERATRLAHHLEAQGIGAGDHVAIYLYNGTEYLETMLAAFKLRAVPINVNYRYGEDELRYLLDDADARAIVHHRELSPALDAIRAGLPRLRTFVEVDDESDAASLADATEYEVALAAASPTRDFGPRSADDRYILYTGGTTGRPKGVVWRAEDVFFSAFGGGNLGDTPITEPEQVVETLELHRRGLPACPFMHGTAHWMAFATLYSGGTIVIAPEHRFDPEQVWRLIDAERITFLVIVGDAFARPAIEAYDQLDPPPDVASLTVVLSGGAVLSPSVKAAWVDRLPGTLLVDGFGASETGGQGLSVSAAGGRVGNDVRFLMDDETTVLDDDLRPVPRGVVGWLARRGHVPLGYYGDPEKTVLTFPVVDGVRWSVPGDHARIEDDGTITVLGRGSVSINTGGEKVYPEEVESALKSHDPVFDAVVVGVPDDRWGERVTAVVQARPGRAPTLDDIAAHVRAQLASYKVPRGLVLVDAIVRSPSGKPDYRWAREVAARAATSSDARPGEDARSGEDAGSGEAASPGS
jgi:acyl-CoA synthetase (AMP-forming)/AMP-acid ligase II